MSIAIAFVAKTGVVLGTDSRVTLTLPEGVTREDAYPKLVQFGSHPIGLAMVGAGSYGGRDFRSLVAEAHGAAKDPTARPTVEGVAKLLLETVGPIAKQAGQSRGMNVLVAGYGPDDVHAELWEASLPEGGVQRLTSPGSNAFVWRGRSEAAQTLWWGANLGALAATLDEAEIDAEQKKTILEGVRKRAAWGPERTAWGMPLSSAAELVRFQLEVQIQAERFLPGRGHSGPPTQLVAINNSGLHWLDAPFATFANIG